jgi:hypothetical protein
VQVGSPQGARAQIEAVGDGLENAGLAFSGGISSAVGRGGPTGCQRLYEDRNTSAGLVSRFNEELNPAGGRSLVCRLEFIDAKEEVAAPCNLVADCRSLDRPVCGRSEDKFKIRAGEVPPSALVDRR